MSDIKEISDGEIGYVGAKTADGGYFVVLYRTYDSLLGDSGYVRDAAWAYGIKSVPSLSTDDIVEIQSVPTEAVCQDIADFASVLAGKIILKTGYKKRTCTLKIGD